MEYVHACAASWSPAVLTTIGAAFAGEWLVTLILLLGDAAHGWL